MDNRIKILNTLKGRLNNLVINQKNIKQDKNTYGNKYLRLRAIMLNENVQSGLAFDECTFTKNEAYSEFSERGQISFHIYPIVDEASKIIKNKVKTQNEVKKQKLSIETEIN